MSDRLVEQDRVALQLRRRDWATERTGAELLDERPRTRRRLLGEILRQVTNSDPWAFVGADNASISHIVISELAWRLRRFNDCSHLERELTSAPEPLT